ncbi:MAG: DUF4279 domain-containing protein [Acetobacteraceae bacterium]|nr:DUF4279 domain-containing protein [Acetobacteraceae bacterium]
MYDHSAGSPFATIRLFSDDLHPEQISQIMGIEPEAAACKGGGLLKKADGTRTPARTGTWFLTTQNRVAGAKPEEHLHWLVELVTTHLDELRSTIPDLRADLSLLVHDREFEPASLPAELLGRAVSLGDLEIEVPERGIDVVLTPRNVAGYIQRRYA